MIHGIEGGAGFTMRDVQKQSTSDPQQSHKLFTLAVNNLWIIRLLRSCNDLLKPILGLCERGDLPTMKSQLSQLP